MIGVTRVIRSRRTVIGAGSCFDLSQESGRERSDGGRALCEFAKLSPLQTFEETIGAEQEDVAGLERVDGTVAGNLEFGQAPAEAGGDDTVFAVLVA